MKEAIVSAEENAAIKRIQLDLLKEVDRICNEYNINYCIGWGTLLGAVRHKGFIPWDDDADILMLRRDYKKFSEVCKKELEEKYFFQDDESDDDYLWGYGKLRNINTCYIRCGQEHIPCKTGVYIDIFPLDNIPNFLPLQILQDVYCLLLRKMLWAKVGKYSESNKIVKVIYKGVSHIPKKFIFKMRNLMICKSDRVSEKVRCLLMKAPGNQWNKENNPINIRYGFKKEWILERRKLSFEGETLWGTKDYKSCLTFLYGDYMKLPPEEKRKGHAPMSKIALNGEGVLRTES